MPMIFSFLQTACHFIKSLAVNVTKKNYRTAAVFVTALAVVTVVQFNSVSFAGGGKNNSRMGITAEDGEEQETDALLAVLVPEGMEELPGPAGERLIASGESGRIRLGALIQEEKQKGIRDEAEEQKIIEEKLRKEAEEEAARLAEEERKAEEERRREAGLIACSVKDVEVLCRIVQAEAGGCDEKGKILVADVIINRVKDGEFPDSITDVVYERGQFSPVGSGIINSVKVTEETRDCVRRALDGEDYSEGALYFMNRGASAARNVSWFDTHLTFVLAHQGHEFFK